MADTSPAISLEVKGEDDTVVDGLYSQLSEVLARGRGRVPLGVGVAVTLVGGIAYVVGMLSILADQFGFPRSPRTGNTLYPWWAWAVSLGPALALGAFVIWVLPSLELLAPGQVNRFRRLRLWILGFVSAVIASIVAALAVR